MITQNAEEGWFMSRSSILWEKEVEGPSYDHVLSAGDLVLCTYRLPSVHQYWINPVHIGRILRPLSGPIAGSYSSFNELKYCREAGYLPIRWSFGKTYYDRLSSLFPSPFGFETSVSVLDSNIDEIREILQLSGKEFQNYFNWP